VLSKINLQQTQLLNCRNDSLAIEFDTFPKIDLTIKLCNVESITPTQRIISLFLFFTFDKDGIFLEP
jgi:hypothetical protein